MRDDRYYVQDTEAWKVCGPDGFCVSIDNKVVAYAVSKMLSGYYFEAKLALDTIVEKE